MVSTVPVMIPLTVRHSASTATTLYFSLKNPVSLTSTAFRFNSRTYESGGVMAVVKAHAAAEHLLRDYEFGQSEEDRHNGWRYFLEETDLSSGDER